jgi:hypothetical protein
MRVHGAFVIVSSLLFAATALGQNASSPSATPGPDPNRKLTLNLNDLIEFQQERGHAEFDVGARRELWQDPMVRLAVGLAREQSAETRGGLVGSHGPWNATSLLVTMPGADPRLVLAGPFATDWHELTPQEKVGRVAEQAVYLGLIIGILRNLR